MSQYIRHFPKPLLDDLVAGRWLPVIGAGMSRNAVVASGRKVPLWDELGRALAADLQDYPYAGALDAVSAYAHEYGRPRMIERVAEALLKRSAPWRCAPSLLLDSVRHRMHDQCRLFAGAAIRGHFTVLSSNR